MPNGDLRFYQNNNSKAGVSELVTNLFKNIAHTITCGNINNVIVEC